MGKFLPLNRGFTVKFSVEINGFSLDTRGHQICDKKAFVYYGDKGVSVT